MKNNAPKRQQGIALGADPAQYAYAPSKISLLVDQATAPRHARPLHPNPHILLIGACGYIGSYLTEALHRDGYAVDQCDRLAQPGVLYPGDYALLSRDTLAPYTHVLWFAGHSSVSQAVKEPVDALRNNCIELFELAQKLSPRTHLIYASTASLYSSNQVHPAAALESDLVVPGNNAYDTSKFAFDYIASNTVTTSWRNFGRRLRSLVRVFALDRALPATKIIIWSQDISI